VIRFVTEAKTKEERDEHCKGAMTMLFDEAQVEKRIAGRATNIICSFNLAKNCSHWLTDRWHRLEQSSFADQDVQKDLAIW
jgi:hypothetical protein